MTHPITMRILVPFAFGLCTCAALGGCGEKADSGAVQAAKGGEVLPRSITDDMLPYDTVRSQSAPDQQLNSSQAPDDASGKSEETAETTATESPAATASTEAAVRPDAE